MLFSFARAMGVRIVDKGDNCGLCGKREATPANLPLASLDLPQQAFQRKLQHLLT